MADTQLAEDARALRAKLAPAGAWTQGALACNAQGDAVGVRSDEAVSWCLDGARLTCIGGGPDWALRIAELRRAMRAECGDEYVDWNDAPGRTQAEVLAMLDRVIATAEVSQ